MPGGVHHVFIKGDSSAAGIGVGFGIGIEASISVGHQPLDVCRASTGYGHRLIDPDTDSDTGRGRMWKTPPAARLERKTPVRERAWLLRACLSFEAPTAFRDR